MTETDLKQTPLYQSHLDLGARMVPYAGYRMPVQYAGIIEEHNDTRNAAGIFDVSHMTQFRVSGSGQQVFLDRMFTNDISAIEETGAAQYTLMLDGEGGIIDDLIVYNTGMEYLIVGNAANHEKDFAWLQAHKPDDVELVDESERTAMIALQGPETKRIMDELTNDDYELPERFHINAATIDTSVPVLVARTGYTGEDGVELISRAEDAEALWRILLSFPEVTPVGLGARDTLRLEQGYHLYGNDMDQSRNPIEAKLGWVCPKNREGYIGADAVAHARKEGVDQTLVHLRVDGGIPRPGQAVVVDDKIVGTVGSGSHSPSLGFGIATVYVPTDLSEVGTKLHVEIRKKLAEATVVKPPFSL